MMKQHVYDIFMLENPFCLVINEFFIYVTNILISILYLEGTVGVKPTYQDFADPDLNRSDTQPNI